MKLELVRGDITLQVVDAIVNAANPALAGGGGVDGAIHRAGGPAIMEECRRAGGCRPGDAVATGAGDLRARYVIHAVGPVWRGGKESEPELLASAYRRSVETAAGLGCQSVAFPSISTGIYGFPVTRASTIALASAWAAGQRAPGVGLIRFVLFSDDDLAAYRAAQAKLSLSA